MVDQPDYQKKARKRFRMGFLANRALNQSSHAKAGLHRFGANSYEGRGGQVYHRVGRGEGSRFVADKGSFNLDGRNTGARDRIAPVRPKARAPVDSVQQEAAAHRIQAQAGSQASQQANQVLAQRYAARKQGLTDQRQKRPHRGPFGQLPGGRRRRRRFPRIPSGGRRH